MVSSTLLFLKRLCCLPRYNVTTFKIFVYAGASINMDYHSVFLPKLCTNPDFSFNRTVGLRNSFNQEYDMTLSIVMSMTSPTSDSHFSQGATHTAGKKKTGNTDTEKANILMNSKLFPYYAN